VLLFVPEVGLVLPELGLLEPDAGRGGVLELEVFFGVPFWDLDSFLRARDLDLKGLGGAEDLQRYLYSVAGRLLKFIYSSFSKHPIDGPLLATFLFLKCRSFSSCSIIWLSAVSHVKEVLHPLHKL